MSGARSRVFLAWFGAPQLVDAAPHGALQYRFDEQIDEFIFWHSPLHRNSL
jgi:hypothetical protein